MAKVTAFRKNKKTGRRVRPDFGRQIREARKAAELTQIDLAAKSGVAQSSIAHIERGQCRGKTDTLVALAEALGMRWELVTGKMRG